MTPLDALREKSRRDWLVRLLFVQPWPVWMLLGGFVIAFALAWLTQPSGAARATFASNTLELMGLGTVAFGLVQTRRDFQKPRWQEIVREWLKQLQLVFAKPKPILLHATASETITVGVSAALTVEQSAAETLDARVARLARELEDLKTHLRAGAEKARDELTRVEAKVDAERTARHQEIQGLKQTLENVAVGGLHLEWVGVMWLFVGLVLGTY